MSNKIKGIPEGWELVAFRRAVSGDYFLNTRGLPEPWTLNVSSGSVFAIIRKIEKPKQFRQFANAAEFEQHRDRWVEYTSPNYGDCSMYRVSAYTSERVWLGPDNVGRTYKEAFHCLRFADGSPFGVEVME